MEKLQFIPLALSAALVLSGCRYIRPDSSKEFGPLTLVVCEDDSPTSIEINGQIEFPESVDLISVVFSERLTGRWVLVKELQIKDPNPIRYSIKIQGEIKSIEEGQGKIESYVTLQKDRSYQVDLIAARIRRDGYNLLFNPESLLRTSNPIFFGCDNNRLFQKRTSGSDVKGEYILEGNRYRIF